MKYIAIFLLALQALPASADRLTLRKCLCASDTRIGFVTTYWVHVDSMGLGPYARWVTKKDMIRDDYRAGAVVGYKCKEGNTRDCVRVPDLEQYGCADEMTPRSHK